MYESSGGRNMRKKILVVVMAFFCMFSTGCSGIQQKAKQIATDWKADGREYGEEKRAVEISEGKG